MRNGATMVRRESGPIEKKKWRLKKSGWVLKKSKRNGGGGGKKAGGGGGGKVNDHCWRTGKAPYIIYFFNHEGTNYGLSGTKAGREGERGGKKTRRPVRGETRKKEGEKHGEEEDPDKLEEGRVLNSKTGERGKKRKGRGFQKDEVAGRS